MSKDLTQADIISHALNEILKFTRIDFMSGGQEEIAAFQCEIFSKSVQWRPLNC